MASIIYRPPSLSRLSRLLGNTRDKSILRFLEYERLAQLGLTGLVLDYGGGSRVNYSAEIRSWGDAASGFDYESVNIDPKTEPTYLIKIGERIPVENNRYDAIISFNTFEHIYNLAGTFDELYRVLRSNGRLIFCVPFIFPVHSHPDDYTRGTPSFWRRFLDDRGFVQPEIEALTWGPFSTGQTVSGIPGPFKRLRRLVALWMDLLLYRYRRCRHSLGATTKAEWESTAPIAYFIITRKSQSQENGVTVQ